MNEKIIGVVGQMALTRKGASFYASQWFLDASLADQWEMARASQRALDKIVSLLSEKLAEYNKSRPYEVENESIEERKINK